MSWQENCAKRLNHSMQTEADMIDKVNSDIAMDKYISDNSANQKYMYSDVTYADEMEIAFKPNHNENRSYQISFYELTLKDGRIRYRSANNIDDLYAKYGDIFKSIRQIKQADYDILRQQASQLNQDDIS